MSKHTKKVPSYRVHKASGQAVVTLGGKDHYLGKYGMLLDARCAAVGIKTIRSGSSDSVLCWI